MTFRVLWPERAMQSLAATFLAARAAGDTEAVNDAVVEAERLLARAPQTAGESRSGAIRLLIVAPVAVEFEVFEDDRVVVVSETRYVPPRPGRG